MRTDFSVSLAGRCLLLAGSGPHSNTGGEGPKSGRDLGRTPLAQVSFAKPVEKKFLRNKKEVFPMPDYAPDLAEEITPEVANGIAVCLKLAALRCRSLGYSDEAIALSAMTFGGRLMTETKGSVLFTIRCLEKVASTQMAANPALIKAEVSAIETVGTA